MNLLLIDVLAVFPVSVTSLFRFLLLCFHLPVLILLHLLTADHIPGLMILCHLKPRYFHYLYIVLWMLLPECLLRSGYLSLILHEILVLLIHFLLCAVYLLVLLFLFLRFRLSSPGKDIHMMHHIILYLLL